MSSQTRARLGVIRFKLYVQYHAAPPRIQEIVRSITNLDGSGGSAGSHTAIPNLLLGALVRVIERPKLGLSVLVGLVSRHEATERV